MEKVFPYIRILFSCKKELFYTGVSFIFLIVVQLMIPIYGKKVIDEGIGLGSLNLLMAFLIVQFVLFASKLLVETIRVRSILEMSFQLNTRLSRSFLKELVSKRIVFFYSKSLGELIQLYNDQARIENFITSSLISLVMALFNTVLFSIYLLNYSRLLFWVFAGLTFLQFIWSRVFLKARKEFELRVSEFDKSQHNYFYQFFRGIIDLKLSLSEDVLIHRWEEINSSLYKNKIGVFRIGLFQKIGSFVLNDIRNLGITIYVASLIVKGELTIGDMFTIQFLISQLTSPIDQLIGFNHSMQSVLVSIERASKFKNFPDEETELGIKRLFIENDDGDDFVFANFKRVDFVYPECTNEKVLKEISFKIRKGDFVAIIGCSGSGKSTILKLLLKVYNDYGGEISVVKHGGVSDLKEVPSKVWRDGMGTMLSDGIVFNESLQFNITFSNTEVNKARLHTAIRISCLCEILDKFEYGLMTHLGEGKLQLSAGQLQRVLIARAIYNCGDSLIMDEPTSHLDKILEKKVCRYIRNELNSTTRIIATHSIEFAQAADYIIVIENGCIVEIGEYRHLISQNGSFSKLINS